MAASKAHHAGGRECYVAGATADKAGTPKQLAARPLNERTEKIFEMFKLIGYN